MPARGVSRYLVVVNTAEEPGHEADNVGGQRPCAIGSACCPDTRSAVNVPLWVWIILLAVIAAMLAVDLLMHRRAHEIAVKEAALWSAIWVSIGLIAGGVIWWFYGADFGLQYYSGYLIEKSLSVDNVFVWAVIFTFFAVPKQYQHRGIGSARGLHRRRICVDLECVLGALHLWCLLDLHRYQDARSA